MAVLVLVGGAQAAGGALDPSFGSRGKVLTSFGAERDGAASAVAVQKDGKIVAAGEIVAAGGSGHDFALARYTPSGTLDRSFGSGGKVVTDIATNSDDAAVGVAVQKDGKIVAPGCSGGDFALARYTTRGTLDRSFGSGGKVLTDIAYSEDAARGFAVQTDGKIVVAGWSGLPPDFALVRYTASGKLDTSFGTSGKVVTPVGQEHNGAWAVAVQKDGKIVAAGWAVRDLSIDIALVRYTTSGVLDRSFGSGGKVVTDIGSGAWNEAKALAVQADGRIIAAGSIGDGIDDFALVRYTTTGRLDAGFGRGGKVLTSFADGSEDEADSVAVQPDGKIVAAGSTKTKNGTAFALVRYTTTGKLDPSFGADGKVLTSFGAKRDGAASAVAVQKDGKIVAAGSSGGDFALARYAR